MPAATEPRGPEAGSAPSTSATRGHVDPASADGSRHCDGGSSVPVTGTNPEGEPRLSETPGIPHLAGGGTPEDYFREGAEMWEKARSGSARVRRSVLVPFPMLCNKPLVVLSPSTCGSVQSVSVSHSVISQSESQRPAHALAKNSGDDVFRSGLQLLLMEHPVTAIIVVSYQPLSSLSAILLSLIHI